MQRTLVAGLFTLGCLALAGTSLAYENPNISDPNFPAIYRDLNQSGATFLFKGQQLVSSNKRYRLVMQTDGNLVLYGRSALWSSSTVSSGAYAVFQNDGNFVVRNSSGGALWSTDTWDRGTDYEVGGWEFVVQDDGNLVMYDGWYQDAWASDSCCNPAGGNYANSEVTTYTPNYSNLDGNTVYAAYYSASAISCAELCAQSTSADPASRCNSYSWWPPASGNGICYLMNSHPTTVSTVAGVYSGYIRGRSTL